MCLLSIQMPGSGRDPENQRSSDGQSDEPDAYLCAQAVERALLTAHHQGKSDSQDRYDVKEKKTGQTQFSLSKTLLKKK